MTRAAAAALALLLVAAPAGAPAAGPTDDAYVLGYVTAVLERQLEITGGTVTVRDGVVRIAFPRLAQSDRDRIRAALTGIGGVVAVELDEGAAPAAPAPGTATRPTTAPTPRGPGVRAQVAPGGLEVLPRGDLFAPLIADPRWPHFGLAYQRFVDDRQLTNVAAASLGETIPLLRGVAPGGDAWALGLQAGVFSIFDVDAASLDLVNSDYMVALPATYRRASLSALVRVLHQSSHLGDEFLLRNTVERLNLSFEALDVKLSYELTPWLRVYAGGGYMFRTSPEDLEPWSTQAGLEVRSPRTILGGVFRPIAAVDVQHRAQNDWSTDVSVRAGLQLENLPVLDRKLQLLLEYFRGRSPNGQFFRDEVEYLGLGLHLYLY
jgi:hypothetical protein